MHEKAAEISKQRRKLDKTLGKDPTKASDAEKAALGDLSG